MRFLTQSKSSLVATILLLLVGTYFAYQFFKPAPVEQTTATVARGSVSERVSVSGFVEAKQTADLAFPGSGVITDILVEEGSTVNAGDILATLAATELVAQRAEAVAQLQAAKAAYQKTTTGPRAETVSLSNSTLKTAQANVERVTAEEEQRVQNARIALLSTGLTAQAIDPNEDSVPPVVSGTYRCETQGTYEVTVFSSSAQSGYSYSYSGVESGTALASNDQPAPLGDCGLYLLLTPGSNYHNSKWQIEVPNTRSSAYASLRSAYILTITQAENAIAAATDNLASAQNENALTTASARSEDVSEAAAAVTQAEARIAAIDARIVDRSIVAPFSGRVTRVDINKGELAPNTSAITVLADGSFSLKARIPEIDITKVLVGQKIEAIFDAQSSETLNGVITYVSPVALQIDGVAYFEVTIELAQSPSWLRAGLNADVDIITKQVDEVLRIPKRFITTADDGSTTVLLKNGERVATTTIEVLFAGNDSFVEVSGLSEGAVVIAP